jgi:hypothetical protein
MGAQRLLDRSAAVARDPLGDPADRLGLLSAAGERRVSLLERGDRLAELAARLRRERFEPLRQVGEAPSSGSAVRASPCRWRRGVDVLPASRPFPVGDQR